MADIGFPMHSSEDLPRYHETADASADDKHGVRNRILKMACEQYLKLGFTRVTLDETASALGISKKTLYQHFENKEDLVRAVCEFHQGECDAGLSAIHQDPTLNPLEKLRRQSTFIAEIYSRLSPSLIHDLQRSQPEIWRDVQDHRQKCLVTDFMDLILEGQAKATFRSDIDARLFLKVYTAAIDGVLQPAVLSDLPFRPEEIYATLSRILFEGFLTDPARTEYHDKK
jgi:AcrR family transcriptional regulator